MMFDNREHAAKLLLNKLNQYKEKKDIVVAGIPRGAMPMAKIIADDLNAELSAVLVHKIPHPYNDELAIGSIGLSGHQQLLPYAEAEGIAKSYINSKAQEQLQKLKKRQKDYGLRTPDYTGKIVIIVDDGIATGATTIGAIHEVRAQSPEKIILAVPVSSHDAAEKIAPLVDEFICLYIAPYMMSVGQFYSSFDQVSDEEVVSILHQSITSKEYEASL